MKDLTFIIPDLQVPFHEPPFVDAMARCIEDNKKRIRNVITIGDEQDFQSISTYAMGTHLEFEKTIGKDRDTTVQILKDLQVTDCIRSNHVDRLFQQISRRMPGLIGLPELEIENFWRLPELGIKFHHKGFKFAPGWIALHGDEAGLSTNAGQTARMLSQKTGLNVCSGHTHRMGMQPVTQSIHGVITRTLWGIEVGNAMRMNKAGYMKTHNWQQGWVAFQHDGNTLHPVMMPVMNKSFTFEGVVYKW